MDTRKGFLVELAELVERHLPRRAVESTEDQPARSLGWLRWLGRQLTPNLGSVLLGLILLSTFPGIAAPLGGPAPRPFRRCRITVGTDSEMTPCVQLGSVPFAIWALTVAEVSVTGAKIADKLGMICALN